MPEELIPPAAPEEMPMYNKTLASIGTAGLQQSANLAGAPCEPHRWTVTEMLGLRKAQLLAELANVEAAIKAAEENKGAMNLLDSIAKTGVGSRNY